MNCHIAQDQLLRAADGSLAATQQTALNAHVKSCATCQHFAESLNSLPELLRQDAKSVSVPDADQMWNDVSAWLNAPEEQQSKSRKIAPIIWLAAPLAAAAALVFAFLPQQSDNTAPVIAGANIVQVDYVEIEDPDSTAMVYVDKESGWLVVWADDPAVSSG
jgi:anti-sigma factor RsiW